MFCEGNVAVFVALIVQYPAYSSTPMRSENERYRSASVSPWASPSLNFRRS